ncbi:MAG: BREX system P-loop protein BrxC, partial [Peptococcaceae bacterium]|nr:BREX system P-loop protein BrxC [Peptococcaceae bacterium]
YSAFSGRYAFAFNQYIDEKLYKQNQNYEISLKILTPDSDERGDETRLRMLSGRNNWVLVVMPEDRTFMDEMRLSLQIEKFLRMDATSGIAKFEEIKDAKRREMSERKTAARLFLEEALKEAVIYTNGDKVQTNSKDVASRINEALGKLVDTVYSKLCYIDTAMNESDIRKVLAEQTKQLSIDGSSYTANNNALRDMRQYIADKSAAHLKVSMKALMERFTKAPYGFIEADVQWLAAKLFKDGDIALYYNSEQVSFINKTVDELVRYLTRKEHQEKLMTEKREQATEKQKKAVRQVMKDLLDISVTNDDDDAMMSTFLQYAANLKNSMEMLEQKYELQPAYPGKKVLHDGKLLLQNVLTLKNTSEFFAEVDRNRDDYLDLAEDFEPVKNFFAGEQIGIFNKALDLMKIYEDSRNYIVDSRLESVVEQMQAILKKAAPYSDIHKLPMLIESFTDSYNDLLQQMSEPVRESIEEARSRVFEELNKKDFKDIFHAEFIKRFDNLREKTDTSNNVAWLKAIEAEVDAVKTRCLQEIADKEAKIAEQLRIQAEEEARKQAQQNKPDQKVAEADSNSNGVIETTEPPATYVVKKQKVVSIKSVTNQVSWRIETAEDVKKYIAELEEKLMKQLEENTIIQIEF